jgi:transcriptional regulator with XRE-family HTH domain
LSLSSGSGSRATDRSTYPPTAYFVRIVRTLLDLRLEDVASKAQLDVPRLSRIETGRARLTPETAARIRRALAQAILDRAERVAELFPAAGKFDDGR